MKNGVIQIGICDDSITFLRKAETALQRYRDNNDIRCDISLFSDPYTFLEQPPGEWDIVLLDIEMPGIDGFEVVKILGSQKCRAKIIFMTNHKEWMEFGYDVKAFHYLVKPCQYERLAKVLDAAMDELVNQDSILLQHLGTSTFYHVYIDEIYHVEPLGNHSRIHTCELNLVSPKNFSWWYKTHTSRFYRCHRSHLVNLRYVHSVNDGKVKMKNGLTVPIAVRQSAKFLQALHCDINTRAKYAERL